jgi:hypothetical protein
MGKTEYAKVTRAGRKTGIWTGCSLGKMAPDSQSIGSTAGTEVQRNLSLSAAWPKVAAQAIAGLGNPSGGNVPTSCLRPTNTSPPLSEQRHDQ